jgi:hypothetical protein
MEVEKCFAFWISMTIAVNTFVSASSINYSQIVTEKYDGISSAAL